MICYLNEQKYNQGNILMVFQVTTVILQKGWRCLDCTACEGCGEKHDEANLILCDECDISFHIYCLDPPLDQVPQDTWKCKWYFELFIF